jgi:hypothetical protein
LTNIVTVWFILILCRIFWFHFFLIFYCCTSNLISIRNVLLLLYFGIVIHICPRRPSIQFQCFLIN